MRTPLAVNTTVFAGAAKPVNGKTPDSTVSNNAPFTKFLALNEQGATTAFVDAIEQANPHLDELGANFVGALATRLIQKKLYGDFVRFLNVIKNDNLLFLQIGLAEHLYPLTDAIVKNQDENMAEKLLSALEGKHSYRAVKDELTRKGLGWKALAPPGSSTKKHPLPS
ncbi:MAG: hypothetical protein IT558_03550 [Alphaproteobacteria bacterium]|nr:hypothetical protein [Alphaproteobacteria bacterium]